MVKNQVVSDDLADPTETLITEFINHWENHWAEADRFGQSEKAMIRAHLYFAVARRYLATDGGELHFTKKELKQAIRSAVEVVKSTRASDRDDRVAGDICHNYVLRRLEGWEHRDDFSAEEMVTIRIKLYSEVMERYRKSGYTDLRATKREIQKATEMIDSIRQRRARQQRADDRDRTIRKAQREHGVLADACVVSDF